MLFKLKHKTLNLKQLPLSFHLIPHPLQWRLLKLMLTELVQLCYSFLFERQLLKSFRTCMLQLCYTFSVVERCPTQLGPDRNSGSGLVPVPVEFELVPVPVRYR